MPIENPKGKVHGELSDKVYEKETYQDKYVNGLSPNPDGSGFVKQVVLTSFPESNTEEENVLYIINGVKWKWLSAPIVEPGTKKVLVPRGWNRVLSEPSLHGENGGRSTPVHENVKPTERPQVFSGPVAFQEDITIKGKKLEDYIDSQGGVTQEELEYALAHLPSGSATRSKVLTATGSGSTIWAIPESPDAPKIWRPLDFTSEDLADILPNVKNGDIIVLDEDPDFTSYIVDKVELTEDAITFVTAHTVSSEGDVVTVEFSFDDNENAWTIDYYNYLVPQDNVRIYKHTVEWESAGATLIFYDNNPTPIDATDTGYDLFLRLDAAISVAMISTDNGGLLTNPAFYPDVEFNDQPGILYVVFCGIDDAGDRIGPDVNLAVREDTPLNNFGSDSVDAMF